VTELHVEEDANFNIKKKELIGSMREKRMGKARRKDETGSIFWWRGKKVKFYF